MKAGSCCRPSRAKHSHRMTASIVDSINHPGLQGQPMAGPPIVVPRRDPLTQPEGVVQGYAQTAQRWPSQALVRRPHTISELGEIHPLEKRLPPIRGDLAGYGAKRALGQLIQVRVRVVDEGGVPVQGAMVEVW